MTGPSRSLLYPNYRALELVLTMPEIRPQRIFSVRWPLWQVEVQARFRDSQAFDVVDHFLLRGVLEGRLRNVPDLARFFGISESLASRGTDHLVRIGHLRWGPGNDEDTVGAPDPVLRPTELGNQSVRDGIRYVEKEARQLLLFDAFTHAPLPRTHYDGALRVLLDADEPSDEADDRRRYRRLTSTRAFPWDAVRALGSRPDRARFNVPALLEDLTPVSTAGAWLPAHLVLTEDAVLMFTAAAKARDLYLEGLGRDAPQIMSTLRQERSADPRQFWQEWLRNAGLGRAQLNCDPAGVWRATLAAPAYGTARLPLHRLGSFQVVRNGFFLQLWCDDEAARAAAVRARALAITRQYGISRADFDDTVASVANLLDVPVPTFDELQRHATASGTPEQLRALQALG